MAEQQKQNQASSSQESTAITQSRKEQPREGMTMRSRMPSLRAFSPYDFLAASPFRLIEQMMEEMERMFEAVNPSTPARTGASQLWLPPIEVAQRDGAIVVTAELPGLSQNDVKVQLTSNGLLIQGERKEEHEERQKGVLRSERRYGRFSRLIPLPEEAKTDQAKAQFKNGVLEVTIPVPEDKQQHREIPIQGGDSQASLAA
jgi:HSP20 family protein